MGHKSKRVEGSIGRALFSHAFSYGLVTGEIFFEGLNNEKPNKTTAFPLKGLAMFRLVF